MDKPLTFSEVRRQIGNPVRNQATSAQLDCLAGLIAKLANDGKIRWERGHGRGFTVYDAKVCISRYKAMET
jgi:hypothetical protein